MTDQVFSPVDPNEMFTTSSKELIQAPVNKLLKFHVVELEKTEQINKFKTRPDGTENPDYGKPQPVLIFKGELEEGEAKGQRYSTWITGYYDQDGKPRYSFGDKSKFGKVAEALVGSVAAFQKLTAADIIGLPFQCALQASKTDPTGGRQLLNVDKIMPPDESQHRIAVSSAIPDSVDFSAADFDKALEDAGK